MTQSPFGDALDDEGARPPSPFGSPADEQDDFFEVDVEADLVPEGLYKARVADVTKDISSTGNPMFVWDFILVDNEHAGTTLRSWTSLSPAAIWKLTEVLESFGITGSPGQKVRFRRSDVLDRLCTVEIEHQEYKGRMTAAVKSVSPPPEGAGAKMSRVGVPDDLPF